MACVAVRQSTGQVMFRILYLVVAIAGLLWIVQTRPIWLEPTRAVPLSAGTAESDANREQEEDARYDETIRRTRIVVIAVMGVIGVSEAWILVAGRLNLIRRS